MIQRIGIAYLMMQLGFLCPSAACWAKPPDLPGDVTQRCPEGREGQAFEGFSDRPQSGDLFDQDGAQRSLAERRRAEGEGTAHRHLTQRVVPLEPEAALTPRDFQARILFDIGERCRAIGDRDKARTCYEEAHLLSPNTTCGRVAIDRLRELDRIRMRVDFAEEQDAPPQRELRREPTERRRGLNTPSDVSTPMQPLGLDVRFLEMLRSTQQLGTMRIRTGN